MSNVRALALMGALAGGVTKGIESNEREAREKARDARDGELRQLQIDGIKQERHDNEMLRGAGANVAIQDANAGPMPEGQQFRGAGRGFASMADVQASEAQMNSPEAKSARRQAVLQEINPMQGLQEEDAALRMKSLRSTYMRQIESEGVKGFLDANFAAAPKVEDIEAGKAGAFDLTGMEEFNKVGKIKIPEGARGKWQALDLGNGRKVADFTVLDKDGKPLTAMSGRTLEALHGMSLKEREALADQRYSAGQKAKSDDREFQSLDRYRRSMAYAAGVRAAGGGGGSGSGYASGGGAPIWNDKADDFLKSRYTVKGETGETAVDGKGLQFAKQVALAQSQRNGGDTTSALGYAFEVDEAIKARTKGDPAAINAERARLLATLMSGNQPQANPHQPVENPHQPVRPAPGQMPSRTTASAAAQRPAVSMAQAVAPKSAGQALVDQVMQPHIAALKQMASGVKQAEQQLAAAAKSGDPKAVTAYAQALQAARSQLKAEADKRLGNNAPAFLSSIQ